MPYQFATERTDYSDLASGRVFYNLPGYPAFPIRLADEIFQRCLAIREADHFTGPCSVYDPCCGTGYHLGVLGYLHRESIQEIVASDVNQEAIRTTQKNLSLLNPRGMQQRIDEINEMLRLYGKESHREALRSAQIMQEKINAFANDHPLHVRTFLANALDKEQLLVNLKDVNIDIVFADVPYGQHSQWQNPTPSSATAPPLLHMLEALSGVLSPDSIVAIAFDKRQKTSHEGYRRIDQFQVGKRRVTILKLNR
jgi:16S rRNA G966 N2-methylase RsmD